MTLPPGLWHPQQVIGRRWSQGQSAEQARILGLARDALLFITATGQEHDLEDFRKGPRPGLPEQPPAGWEGLRQELRASERFFEQLREAPDSASERAFIQVILDTLHFISATGQLGALQDYLEHVESKAPPYVLAAFETRRQVEDWLKHHPHPPTSGNVLIGDTYHALLYQPETGRHHLPRIRDLHAHLAELQREHPPRPVVSLASREEARAWLERQPAPARWTWVSIAGEPFLAAYYPHLQHRALFPLSKAEQQEPT